MAVNNTRQYSYNIPTPPIQNRTISTLSKDCGALTRASEILTKEPVDHAIGLESGLVFINSSEC